MGAEEVHAPGEHGFSDRAEKGEVRIELEAGVEDAEIPEFVMKRWSEDCFQETRVRKRLGLPLVTLVSSYL